MWPSGEHLQCSTLLLQPRGLLHILRGHFLGPCLPALTSPDPGRTSCCLSVLTSLCPVLGWRVCPPALECPVALWQLPGSQNKFPEVRSCALPSLGPVSASGECWLDLCLLSEWRLERVDDNETGEGEGARPRECKATNCIVD